MDARTRHARSRRSDRRRFVACALALYLVCGLWATWPAVRSLDDRYLAAPPAHGFGEAAAGDHLQLGWNFWLVGHQLEQFEPPWSDPYSFQPVAEARPNFQGWLYGIPFWPLERGLGPVWAYNLLVLASFLLAGGFTCWWLRALGLSRPAALVGGVVFALAPYRVAQSTGHLLGMVSFLLPALLLALERRRLVAAGLVLAAIPLSGQPHLTLGVLPLALGYAWARLPRSDWARVVGGVGVGIAGALIVAATAVRDSIGTKRSFAQTDRYSAELTDFVTRGVPTQLEELVFVGWLVPLAAVGGLVAARRTRGLAWFLGLAAMIPALLALGANLPGYEFLWRTVPGLGTTRVPERLLPISCLALAALVALLFQRLTRGLAVRLAVVFTFIAFIAIAVDLRVGVFAAVVADKPNAAYTAMSDNRALLELPIIRPGVHLGAVYLAYARQSPRPRPLGYSTLALRSADAWALRHQGLSCGAGQFPREVGWVIVHGGVYRQDRSIPAACRARAEQLLRRLGWRPRRSDGVITVWQRP